ncbi:DUF11 domain-containing protein [Candidatus Woesearchaeota archaeon]|nr:DUF11 domain-containing protein [Candidatus Woesearchaeota archaeon]
MKRGEFAIGLLLTLFSLGLTFALLSIDSPSHTGFQVADVQSLQSSGNEERGIFASRTIQVACTSCADCTTCSATVGNTCTLSGPMSEAGTCITIGADNVTIDCAGNIITFDTGGGGIDAGILATNKTNVTLNNCTIIDSTSSGASGSGVSFINVSHSMVANISIFTNGTTATFGIGFINSSNNNTAQSNTIFSLGTTESAGIAVRNSNDSVMRENIINAQYSSASNAGISILTNSLRSQVFNNSVDVNGISSTLGISAGFNSNYTQIGNNVVSTTGTGAFNIGINVDNGASISNIENNTITTNGTNGNHGIRLAGSASNTSIRNNTIETNGTNSSNGILLTGIINNNVVRSNQIFANGQLGGSNAGIVLSASTGTNNTVQDNSVMTAGGPSDWGISFETINGSTIQNNTITTNGTSQNMGIRLDFESENNTIRNNLIATDGTSNNSFGITVSRSYNTLVENNLVRTFNAQSHGLRVTSASNNTTFVNNSVYTTGTNSFGIAIGGGALGADRNFFNDTRLFNVTQWILVSDSNDTNFTNTTFETPNGTINLPSNFSLNGTLNVTKAQLNILNNTAFINTTNVSQLNTSAIVTLSGLNTSTPRPIVDFNDDRLAEYCDSPQCTLLSFIGGTLRFNVSSFTTYSSTGNVTVEKSDSPDSVGAGSQLSYTITINNTGNDTVFNITVVETYPSGVVFDSSSPSANISNNTWLLGNLANGTFTTINITLTVSSVLADGTVLNNTVNVTFSNAEGINVSVVDTENTTVVRFPQINVTKTDSPDPVNNGSTLEYTITITNFGTGAAVNVTLLENYPANTTFNGSSPAPDAGNNSFSLGNLTEGSSFTVNITVNVSENMTSGILNNTAIVSFINTTGANITMNVSELTTVTTPSAPTPAPSGGGGGGGTNFARNAQINRTLPQVQQPVVQQATASVQSASTQEVLTQEPIQEPILTPAPEPAPQVEPQPISLPKTRSKTAILPIIVLIVLALLILIAMTRKEPPSKSKPARVNKFDDELKELKKQLEQTNKVLKHKIK